jgi:hypothetical protein
MDTSNKSAEKYIALKDGGAAPTAVFQACKLDGHKNWECQILLMGVFEMTLDEARKISHAEHVREKSQNAF